MRYGIPILNGRVAPRCTFAEAVVLVVMQRTEARREDLVALPNRSLAGLADTWSQGRVDTLICGGISRESRDFISARDINIMDNVAGTVDELLAALQAGTLRPGFGLDSANGQSLSAATGGREVDEVGTLMPPYDSADCLACTDRVCLSGKPCHLSNVTTQPVPDELAAQMLEASLDVSGERERTLCRLSELIYFCLEMRYRRIGLAYCEDLREPAEILTRVLRRFFDVFPVSCRIGGVRDIDSTASTRPAAAGEYRNDVVCNPLGQAAVLNDLGTSLNVMVGICMGADCIFTQASDAPVTTLFVKDRSLANNPIGAVYSDYYLGEAAHASERSR